MKNREKPEPCKDCGESYNDSKPWVKDEVWCRKKVHCRLYEGHKGACSISSRSCQP